MATLKELVDRLHWNDIEATLTVRSLIEPRWRTTFRNVFKILGAMAPTHSDLTLLANYVEDETGDYIHVCGVKGQGVSGETERYGLYFEKWSEWLGMDVAADTLAVFSDAEIVAASIHVMSWDGTTEREVRRASRRLSRHRRHLFLSHSHDDKDTVVTPLARELEDFGLSIWYDDFDLHPGDSLRGSIAKAIAKSSCAIVVLSESFFKKAWTERELAGVVAMEMSKRIPIIPVWHKVSLKQVIAYDPSLADRVALSTSVLSPPQIARRIYEAIEARTRIR